MAITYFATAFDTNGTLVSGNTYYKDLTITGAQVGDLLVVASTAASNAGSAGRSIVTQSGSTSAWTATSATPVTSSDCAFSLGHATVSTAGSITIRATLDTGVAPMGVVGWLIPAAEWSGTPAFTVANGDNATGSMSATLAATSNVFMLAGDWSAVNLSDLSLTPTGTLHTDAFVSGQYQSFAASWADQASGTRDYGLAVDPGASDYVIVLCAVPPAGSVSPISLRAAGTSTAATVAVTAVNPSVPTGATTGDLSVLTVWAKPFGTTITTPSGWTKIGEATNGTTAAGTDTGSTKVAVFVKESAAVGAIGALTLGGSPNSVGAVINTYTKDPTYTWDYSAFTTGGDTTNAANYSATGAAGIDVATGDWVLQSTAVNGDVGTQSAQALAGMSGATLGTYVVRQSSDTTTGTDSHGEVGDVPVTAGSSTAAPTFAYTNASSGSGTTLWLRLRQVASGTQYTQSVTASSVTITGSDALVAKKNLLDTVTSTASDAFAVTKSLVDSVSVTAADTVQISKTLLDQIVATAALSSSRVLLRDLLTTCTSTVSASRAVTKPLLGSVTTTASRVHAVNKSLSDVISATSSATKASSRTISDTISSTGSTLRSTAKSLSDQVTSSASRSAASSKTLAASATASASTAKAISRTLLGLISSDGGLVTEFVRAVQTYYQNLTALAIATIPGGGSATSVNLFSTTPSLPLVSDATSITLATEFYVTSTAWLTGVRYLHGTGGDTAARTMAVYSVDAGGTTGTMVAGPFTMPTPTGGEWCSHTLDTPYQLTANTRYRVAYWAPYPGNFVITGYYFSTGDGAATTTIGGLLVLPNKADAEGNRQGSFNYSEAIAFPDNGPVGASACYYADVEVTDSLGGGGLLKSVSKTLSGAVSSTALRVASVVKDLTGLVTGPATVVKGVVKPLTVVIPGTGSLNAVKSQLLALTASVTSSATVRRGVSITRSASRTITATATKASAKTVAASSTLTGSLAQLKAKFLTLAPVVTLTPSMKRATSVTKADVVTVSGTFLKRVSKAFSDSVAITPTLSSSKVFLRALSASVTAVASARRVVSKPLTDVVTATPSVVKRAAKTLTGVATSSATRLASINRVIVLPAVSTAQASAQRFIDLTVPATVDVPASVTKFIDKTISSTTSILRRMFPIKGGRVVYTPPPTIEVIPEAADTAVFVGGIHGPAGAAGPRGPVGDGIPTGGVVGDFLSKAGSAAVWVFRNRVLVLPVGAPIPVGTPRGTIILRRAA